MKRRDSAFAAATEPRWNPLWALLKALQTFFRRDRVQTVRRPATHPTPPVAIYHGLPSHVAELRRHGIYAHRLLRRYNAGLPTTRRAWMSAGYSDNAWRRSRRMLRNAGVTDASGVPVYFGGNAVARLDAYLRRIEDMCRRHNRYVVP